MLGDIILWIKRILKQHVFCIHSYKRHVVGMGEYLYYKCEKCGRIIKEEP